MVARDWEWGWTVVGVSAVIKGDRRKPCGVETIHYLDSVCGHRNLHMWESCTLVNTHKQMSTRKTGEMWIRSVDDVNLLVVIFIIRIWFLNVTTGVNYAKYTRELYHFSQLHACKPIMMSITFSMRGNKKQVWGYSSEKQYMLTMWSPEFRVQDMNLALICYDLQQVIFLCYKFLHHWKGMITGPMWNSSEDRLGEDMLLYTGGLANDTEALNVRCCPLPPHSHVKQAVVWVRHRHASISSYFYS